LAPRSGGRRRLRRRPARAGRAERIGGLGKLVVVQDAVLGGGVGQALAVQVPAAEDQVVVARQAGDREMRQRQAAHPVGAAPKDLDARRGGAGDGAAQAHHGHTHAATLAG
jgi:hypothetical protein